MPKQMGMFTEAEMREIVARRPGGVIHQTFDLIIRHVSRTTNYYRRHSDGSWTNYDCKTDG